MDLFTIQKNQKWIFKGNAIDKARMNLALRRVSREIEKKKPDRWPNDFIVIHQLDGYVYAVSLYMTDWKNLLIKACGEDYKTIVIEYLSVETLEEDKKMIAHILSESGFAPCMKK